MTGSAPSGRAPGAPGSATGGARGRGIGEDEPGRLQRLCFVVFFSLKKGVLLEFSFSFVDVLSRLLVLVLKLAFSLLDGFLNVCMFHFFEALVKTWIRETWFLAFS